MLELGWVSPRPWWQAPVHPIAHHLLLVSCLLDEGHRVEVGPCDLQLDLWQGHIHMQGCCRGPAASCPRCCCCIRTAQGSVRGHIEVPRWKGVLALTGGKVPCCAVGQRCLHQVTDARLLFSLVWMANLCQGRPLHRSWLMRTPSTALSTTKGAHDSCSMS